MNWFEHQVHPSAVQPLLSDQGEDFDQIKSWLCIPSNSNQVDAVLNGGDLSNEQTTVELSHNGTNLMMPHAPEVAVMPSSPMAKRKDVALVSQEKGGTSHAAKAKKKAKENKGLTRSQYQAVGLGSSGKKRRIVDTGFISPKRLRPPEVRRVTERKRRDKFNEKLKELQELLPRCSKLDKASTLDKAIGYIKDLQKQVRMMSGMYDMSMQMYPQMPQPCMPPVRMLSTEINFPALQALHTSMNPAGMIPLAPPPLPQYQHKPSPVNLAFQHSMASAAMFPFPQSHEHPSTFPFVVQGNFRM